VSYDSNNEQDKFKTENLDGALKLVCTSLLRSAIGMACYIDLPT
jgi:hypothetical protein